MKATLYRYYQDDNQTLGLFKVSNVKHSPIFTMERPWKNNQKNISCIPIGIYTVTFLSTPRFPGGVYQLQNVPNRSGIDIHAANKASELEGCIAIGRGVDTLGAPIAITASATALQDILIIFGKNQWELTISNL
jgi:hypothetical protein